MWPHTSVKGFLTGTFGMLPFGLAVIIAKQLLAAQGFGAGAGVRFSGEKGVSRAPTI